MDGEADGDTGESESAELGESESNGVGDEETELADLDPNAEKQARRVERQLQRLQREMRG